MCNVIVPHDVIDRIKFKLEYTNSKGQTFHGYVNVSYIKSDNELKSGGKKKVTASKPKNTQKSKFSPLGSMGL